MKANGLRYERTFNRGQYESEKIMIEVALEDGESPNSVLKEMMDFVNSKGETSLSSSTKVVATSAPEKTEVVKKEKKTAAKETVVEVKKEVETASVEAAKETAAEEKSPEVKAKKTKETFTKYDRNSDLHKKLIAEFLDDAFPQWKSKAQIAKEMSLKLNGEDFMDRDGLVIKPFRKEFLSGLGVEI